MPCGELVAGSWWRDWRLWAGAAALAGAVLVVVVAVWPDADPEEPRARQYRESTACLLTGAGGLTGSAVPAWEGMQHASLSTLVRVRFLEVDGPATVDNARSYLGSLVAGGCDLVIAVGEPQVGAVLADATAYPDIPFLVVGAAGIGSNVSQLAAGSPDAVRAAVSRVVVETLGSGPDTP